MSTQPQSPTPESLLQHGQLLITQAENGYILSFRNSQVAEFDLRQVLVTFPEECDGLGEDPASEALLLYSILDGLDITCNTDKPHTVIKRTLSDKESDKLYKALEKYITHDTLTEILVKHGVDLVVDATNPVNE